MPSLPRLQQDFGAAILGGDSGAIAAAVAGGGLAAGNRVAIHRNHFVISLTEALATTFPVVRRLLGPDYFAQVARRHIGLSPPAGPCLFEYGADFAAMLQRLPALADYPYVPDVARLEWLINLAYHANDASTLSLAAVAAAPPRLWAGLVLTAHPASALLRSAWPVDAIWRAHQDEVVADVDLSAGPVAILVSRRGDDVEWRRLEPGRDELFEALADGQALAPALERSAVIGIDPVAALTDLIDAGAFTELPSFVRI